MDSTPFLSIDLTELRDNDILELKKFEKSAFDVDTIIHTASDLKYCGLIKQFFKDEFAVPSDDFVKLILSSGIYEGRLMQNIIEKFKPIVKKSISQYLNEWVMLIHKRINTTNTYGFVIYHYKKPPPALPTPRASNTVTNSN